MKKRIICVIMLLTSLLFLTSCTPSTKFGVISDIHADNKGLEYFLEQFDKQQVDAIIAAGDIVEHFRNNVSDYDELNQTLFLLSEQKVPVFVLPGNHENQADYAQLVEYYKTINPKIIDLASQNAAVFNGITIIGLPGYEIESFLAEDGFLLENQRIKSIIDEVKQRDENNNGNRNNNNNKNEKLNNNDGKEILLVSHGPPKGKNHWSIDALADGTNVGNLFLDQIMKQEGIQFIVSGHIHEAGQKAVNEDDEVIAQNEWSNSLRLNAGSVIAWKMNSGSISQGSAAILEIKEREARYKIIKR